MTSIDSTFTQDYLKECFDYSPDTGILTWKVRPRHHFKTNGGHKLFNRDFAGKEAGYIKKGKGGYYHYTKILKVKYATHRLIMIMEYGRNPSAVDHIDGNGLNNRLGNLRYANSAINAKNKRLSCRNVSGIHGVSWYRRDRGWAAKIGVDGEKIYLGFFKSFFEACCARKSAEIEYDFHPNHGRNI